MNKQEIEAFVRDHVSNEDLADYLCAPSGWTLGVYPNGSVNVGDAVGREIDPEERPIALAGCPGLGNLDMTWWREGWDCEGLDNEKVVRTCCKDGDVSGEWEDLVARLVKDAATMKDPPKWELAVQVQHGAWEHWGDYESFDAAMAEAKDAYPHVWRNDEGLAVFGLSDDPNSGHYEHTLEVSSDEQGIYVVHLEGGVIVDTL